MCQGFREASWPQVGTINCLTALSRTICSAISPPGVALRRPDVHEYMKNAASVDAEFHAGMKQHHTEAEIMELGAFIALHYGMRVFMRTPNQP